MVKFDQWMKNKKKSLQIVFDVTLVKMTPFFVGQSSASGPKLPFDVPGRKAPICLWTPLWYIKPYFRDFLNS